ncbi:MAG: hypothetical protein WEA35_05905 [Candidatus Nanopelagicales bacterium]
MFSDVGAKRPVGTTPDDMVIVDDIVIVTVRPPTLILGLTDGATLRPLQAALPPRQ